MLKLSFDGKASLSKEGIIYKKSVNVMYNEYFGTPKTLESICGTEDIVNSFKGLCRRLGINNPEVAIDTREGYIPNIIKVLANHYNGMIHDNEIAKALRRERSSISNARTVYQRDFGFDVNLMKVQSEFDKYLNLDVPAKSPIVQNIVNEIWEDIERYSWNAIKRQKEFYIKKFEKQL